MSIYLDPAYGPTPSLQLTGGSPSSLATPSQPLLGGGRSITLVAGQLRTVSYVEVYRTQPWVGRGCKAMTEQVARLPLHLNRYLDDSGTTSERDRKHAAARLLRRPRPGQTGLHFRWDLALSLWVHGNYVGWKRRPSRGAPPRELWTLDWRSLIPIGVGGRVVSWEWRGDGVPGLERGQRLDPSEVLHVGFGSPGGGTIGISPLEQLGVTIRNEDAAQRYSEANYRNGTRFGVGVILDKSVKADKATRDGVREELMDAHGGIDQAFKPAVLGGGITDIKPLGEQTAHEAELIAQRRVNREEIAGVIGIPAPVLGILDEANYGAMGAFERFLYVTALGGPLELIAASVQAQLLDEESAWAADDRYVEFSLDGVLKGDPKTRWETYAVALDHGGLTLNDVRRRENLPPYDDERANEPLIAANNVRPLSAVGTGPTGNGTAGRRAADQAAVIDELVNAAVDRGLERAARGVGAGRDALQALNRERLERELVEDLEGAGVAQGSSIVVADVVASNLEARIADAAPATVDDVRALAADLTSDLEEDPVER